MDGFPTGVKVDDIVENRVSGVDAIRGWGRSVDYFVDKKFSLQISLLLSVLPTYFYARDGHRAVSLY